MSKEYNWLNDPLEPKVRYLVVKYIKFHKWKDDSDKCVEGILKLIREEIKNEYDK